MNDRVSCRAQPLQFMHGLGEEVVQLSIYAVPPPSPSPPSPPPQRQPSRTARATPLVAVPLVAPVTNAYSRVAVYVHGHWGVEAAALFLVLALGVLCMVRPPPRPPRARPFTRVEPPSPCAQLAHIAHVFCEYSLCCFHRRRAGRVKSMPRP